MRMSSFGEKLEGVQVSERALGMIVLVKFPIAVADFLDAPEESAWHGVPLWQ